MEAWHPFFTLFTNVSTAFCKAWLHSRWKSASFPSFCENDLPPREFCITCPMCSTWLKSELCGGQPSTRNFVPTVMALTAFLVCLCRCPVPRWTQDHECLSPKEWTNLRECSETQLKSRHLPEKLLQTLTLTPQCFTYGGVWFLSARWPPVRWTQTIPPHETCRIYEQPRETRPSTRYYSSRMLCTWRPGTCSAAMQLLLSCAEHSFPCSPCG